MPSHPPASADTHDFRAILAALGGHARVLLLGAVTVGLASFALPDHTQIRFIGPSPDCLQGAR